jgi:preprotein translocase subunit YajC
MATILPFVSYMSGVWFLMQRKEGKGVSEHGSETHILN